MAALLIVDDDPIIRENLRRLFADKYECDTADRAEQALELAEIHKYAAIITDFSMPGAGGGNPKTNSDSRFTNSGHRDLSKRGPIQRSSFGDGCIRAFQQAVSVRGA